MYNIYHLNSTTDIMRIGLLLFLLIVFTRSIHAQKNGEQWIKEGIALHDAGDYLGAIKKYDSALIAEPSNWLALYEKAYSFLLLKEYPKTIDLCKKIVKGSPASLHARQAYIAWATALDYQGNGKESLKIFDEAIKEFPGFYLLYFNKAMTLHYLEDIDGAVSSLQQSLAAEPMHASSHYYTGELLKQTNKVPSLLAYLSFLIMEPRTERSHGAAEAIRALLYSNIQRDEKTNATTIYITSSSLGDKKNGAKENDFTPQLLLLSLITASDKQVDSMAKTPAEKLDINLQLLINALQQGQGEGKGFYWNFYVPFFVELKMRGYTDIVAHIYYWATDENYNPGWIQKEEKRIDSFYEWVDNFQWSDKGAES